MQILVFDTETTGLVDFKKAVNAPEQPRMLQIAAVLLDTDNWFPRAVMSLLIKHDEPVFCMPEAMNTHGITQELRYNFGVSPSYALHIFNSLVQKAKVCYAYNADFDLAIVGNELLRLKRETEYNDLRLKTQCIMKPLADIIAIKSHGGRNKYPKLDEAYMFYYSEPRPSGAHDALMDVDCACKVLRKYLEQKKA